MCAWLFCANKPRWRKHARDVGLVQVVCAGLYVKGELRRETCTCGDAFGCGEVQMIPHAHTNAFVASAPHKPRQLLHTRAFSSTHNFSSDDCFASRTKSFSCTPLAV